MFIPMIPDQAASAYRRQRANFPSGSLIRIMARLRNLTDSRSTIERNADK